MNIKQYTFNSDKSSYRVIYSKSELFRQTKILCNRDESIWDRRSDTTKPADEKLASADALLAGIASIALANFDNNGSDLA